MGGKEEGRKREPVLWSLERGEDTYSQIGWGGSFMDKVGAIGMMPNWGTREGIFEECWMYVFPISLEVLIRNLTED